jgi:hypothetical protein
LSTYPEKETTLPADGDVSLRFQVRKGQAMVKSFLKTFILQRKAADAPGDKLGMKYNQMTAAGTRRIRRSFISTTR